MPRSSPLQPMWAWGIALIGAVVMLLAFHQVVHQAMRSIQQQRAAAVLRQVELGQCWSLRDATQRRQCRDRIEVQGDGRLALLDVSGGLALHTDSIDSTDTAR